MVQSLHPWQHVKILTPRHLCEIPCMMLLLSRTHPPVRTYLEGLDGGVGVRGAGPPAPPSVTRRRRVRLGGQHPREEQPDEQRNEQDHDLQQRAHRSATRGRCKRVRMPCVKIPASHFHTEISV